MTKNMKRRAMAMGMAAVMAVAANGAPNAVEAKVATAKNLKKVTITKTISLGQGYKKTIAVKNAPAKAKIAYTTKNKKVATVSKKGVVTAKKTGKTEIRVKFTYNKKSVVKKCKVTVKKAVKKVTLKKNSVSLKVGSTYDITKKNKVTIAPASAFKTVSYTSSKKSVATVTAKGKVTAKKAGTAKITVKAQDGSGKRAVLTVTVTKKTVPSQKPTETTAPTQGPTQAPTVAPTATTAPTQAPTQAPTAVPTATTAPTQAPTQVPTAVPTETPEQNVKKITASDLDANKAYTLTGTYDKVVISSNVGDNAKITIADGTKINTLTVESGASYAVDVKQAVITNTEVVEPAKVATQSFAAQILAKTPTVTLSANAEVISIKVEADIVIKGTPVKMVQTITIAKKANVAVEAPTKAVVVSKDAAAAAITIAAKVESVQVAAPNTALDVEKAASVDAITVSDTAASTAIKVDGTVTKVDTSADSVKISGTGSIQNTEVKGNNTSVSNDVKTTVKVGEGITGTTVGDKNVAGGTTQETTGGNSGNNSGGSSSGGSSSGGSSSGGSSSGGGSSVTPTPTPSYRWTEAKTYTNDQIKTMEKAPSFKATYKDGKVKIYSIDEKSLKDYFYSDDAKATIKYTVVEMTKDKTETTYSGEALPRKGASVTEKVVTIDEFKCQINLNSSEKTCSVKVGADASKVETVEFVNTYATQSYNKKSKTKVELQVTKGTSTDTYKIDYSELARLYDQQNGTTLNNLKYTKNDKTVENGEAKKDSDTKGTCVIDGIKCEVYVNEDVTAAYVVVSSNAEGITALTLK